MKELVMVVGPPAAGKTTFSERYVEDGFTYLSQDLLGNKPFSLFLQTIFSQFIEKGENVVVELPGFSKSQRSQCLDFAKDNGYKTTVIVLHQPYSVCLERCLSREGHPTNKDEKRARKTLDMFFAKYERVTNDEADTVIRKWPEGDKPKAVIVDLDGTLCNVEHRRHFVSGLNENKKDWDGFFGGIKNDTPNEWCVKLLRAMAIDHKIVYCSGRSDNLREATMDWLIKYDLRPMNYKISEESVKPDFHLYMRPYKDSRKDDVVKEIILDFELLTRFTPLFMIDDRKQVVEMYRSRGFTCLQCDEGNF